MITIIIGAIVSMLVYFFQRWWTENHPIVPKDDEAKKMFVAKVARPRNFWMGPKREEYAGKLFDKYVQKLKDRPIQRVSHIPMSEDEAGIYAATYAEGLTLEPDEL